MQNRLAVLLTCVLLLSACTNLRFPGVYRIDIEQGNIVNQEMLGKLRAGMTEPQVRFVMGTPQLIDPFEPGRWVYLYRLRRGSGEMVEAKVVLWLENGSLVRWEGAPLPDSARSRINTAGAGAAGTEQTTPRSP